MKYLDKRTKTPKGTARKLLEFTKQIELQGKFNCSYEFLPCISISREVVIHICLNHTVIPYNTMHDIISIFL